MTKALFMAAAAGGSVAPTYVDDVFSTWLYTGNGSTQTITNGIDLAGQGGLVWVKSRNNAIDHSLMDTVRGASNSLSSNTTTAEATPASISAFLSTGFSLGTSGASNLSAYTYASWTFRKAPKFFDVVTFTANGSSNQRISHSLGVAPGCIFIKRTNSTESWYVYHRSTGRSKYLVLNSTVAEDTFTDIWGTSDPTASDFGVSNLLASSGSPYVAYLFAHDTATDGMIQCGSFSHTFNTATLVTLGWEAQWVLIKQTDDTSNWLMYDVMRGIPVGGDREQLYADFSNAAAAVAPPGGIYPTATGFVVDSQGANTGSCVYIAIRRPNKPPAVGTEVYYAESSAQADTIVTTGVPFPPDLVNSFSRNGTDRITSYDLFQFVDRLRSLGVPSNSHTTSTDGIPLQSSSTGNEAGFLSSFVQLTADSRNVTKGNGWNNASFGNWIQYFFKRAPGFFDVVCDTGTGSAHTIAHNLGAVPELIIRKSRSGTTDWQVYCANLANTQKLVLNSTAAVATDTAAWNSTTPTASVFTVGTGAAVNTNGATYVTYLFDTLAGISKVGTYTGNGSSQTINCGFTTGARFVLIKRTDSTGDWYVWDTARGIVSGNDPHLSLNTTAAEVTSNDTIDPATSGFIVNQVAATNVNVNGATYIYLAIA